VHSKREFLSSDSVLPSDVRLLSLSIVLLGSAAQNDGEEPGHAGLILLFCLSKGFGSLKSENAGYQIAGQSK